MTHVLAWVVLGLAVGVAAHTVACVRDAGGAAVLIGTGVVGAVLGGELSRPESQPDLGAALDLHSWGWALVGAAVLLAPATIPDLTRRCGRERAVRGN